MQMADLHTGQVVRARLGRPGPEDVNWGPWHDVTLHVQRAPTKPPHKSMLKHMVCPPGGIAVLALKNENWAEYGENDYDPHYGLFLVEDYYMQIEGLTHASGAKSGT